MVGVATLITLLYTTVLPPNNYTRFFFLRQCVCNMQKLNAIPDTYKTDAKMVPGASQMLGPLLTGTVVDCCFLHLLVPGIASIPALLSNIRVIP